VEDKEQLKIETELIVKLMREKQADGWLYTTNINDVPETIGHYGLDDGLSGCGGGVTHNMRQSIKFMSRYETAKRPIYSYLPDTDINGDAGLWLDGKETCWICKDNVVRKISERDRHLRDVHGIGMSDSD